MCVTCVRKFAVYARLRTTTSQTADHYYGSWLCSKKLIVVRNRTRKIAIKLKIWKEDYLLTSVVAADNCVEERKEVHIVFFSLE